jgi:hypothetical protein
MCESIFGLDGALRQRRSKPAIDRVPQARGREGWLAPARLASLREEFKTQNARKRKDRNGTRD